MKATFSKIPCSNLARTELWVRGSGIYGSNHLPQRFPILSCYGPGDNASDCSGHYQIRPTTCSLIWRPFQLVVIIAQIWAKLKCGWGVVVSVASETFIPKCSPALLLWTWGHFICWLWALPDLAQQSCLWCEGHLHSVRILAQTWIKLNCVFCKSHSPNWAITEPAWNIQMSVGLFLRDGAPSLVTLLTTRRA